VQRPESGLQTVSQRSAGETTRPGSDVTIRELAFDASKPGGMMHKRLDVSRLAALGWRAKIALEEGLRSTYAWYCSAGSQVLY